MNTPKTFYLATPAGIEKLEKMKQDQESEGSTTIRAFITKHVVSQGVIEKQGLIDGSLPSNFIVREDGRTTVYRGIEWWESEEKALEHALERLKGTRIDTFYKCAFTGVPDKARDEQIKRLDQLINDIKNRLTQLSEDEGGES